MNPNCDMKELLDKAERPAHLQIMSVKDLRGDILHELQNGSRFEGVPITTLPSLNKLLKGHRRGELTVFTGPTGMGKTTVLSQMSLDLCLQGVNTLWGSFEIKNHRLAKTMLNQLHGQSIANCSSEEFDEMFERFEKLPIYFLKVSLPHSFGNATVLMLVVPVLRCNRHPSSVGGDGVCCVCSRRGSHLAR